MNNYNDCFPPEKFTKCVNIQLVNCFKSKIGLKSVATIILHLTPPSGAILNYFTKSDIFFLYKKN